MSGDLYSHLRGDPQEDLHSGRAETRQKVGARELKTRLGTYLRQVKEGATLIVTERGRPIAELRPLSLGAGGLEYALAELTARGVLAGEIGERRELEAFEPIRSSASLSQAVVEDREDRF